jgi:2-dehydropantoate 2-reductase
MKILIVGAGATGGYFGARLVQAGRDVTFLVRAARAEKLRGRGLRVVSPEQNERIEPVIIEASGLTETYDLVLFAVKSTALEQALDDLAPAVGQSTVIIPFLNGLRHLAALNDRFGAGKVLGGVVKIATDTSDDGDILYLGGIVPSLEIGEQDGAPSDRVRDIARELTVDGFDVIRDGDIVAAMWNKWVFIVSLTATTTLMGGTVGDVAAVLGGAAIGAAIVAEAAAVAEAAGYPLGAGAIAAVTGMATQPGSPLTTSLYRDLNAGRPTETEPMVGDFVEQARRLSVATPVLDVAIARLRVYEHRRVSRT